MIKIKQSKNGQYFFTVQSRNNKTWNTTETYTRKSDCKRAARSFHKAMQGELKIIEE